MSNRSFAGSSEPTAYPGRRFALPWAISFCPVGAGGSVDHRRGPIVLCLTGAQGDRRTHGVASLCPGLSDFAPLGRGDRRIAEPKSLFDYRKSNLLDVAGERERGLVVW